MAAAQPSPLATEIAPNLGFPFTIRLFGAFEARLRGELLPPLRTRKGQSLLALLALRAGRALPRASVAATLWPDSAEDQALANLRRSLTDLRHALGAEAHRLQTAAPNTLRLDLAGAQIDVVRFDEAVARGDGSSLEQAVTLYRGRLLEGCEEEWILPEREARQQTYLTILEALAAAAIARGDPATAACRLRIAAAVDPVRESVQRRLMEALAAAGEFSAAKRVYRDLRLLLHRELDAQPDPETSALFERIRNLERRREAEPEAMSPRGFLPQPVSSLVGREAELRRIGDHLDVARLLTLTGEGGVGKTRLAIRVAEERIPLHSGGVWFVDLAPVADGALLPNAVAATLQIPSDPVRAPLETLLRELRDRSALLILDNCEHLLDACAGLAHALLRGCRDLRILATSRHPLGVAGEVTIRVPSLSLPSPNQQPPDDRDPVPLLMEYDGIRLFCERASLARPGWKVERANIRTVAQICQALDGNALAIELAAARVRSLPVEQIAARLDNCLGLLTGGSRTLPRQQTLQATLDWSFDLLSDREQRLLCRLSVFAGGWRLEAAEAVCPDGDVEEAEVFDVLGRLVDSSLVVYSEESPSDRRSLASTERYRLPETIRQYASQQLLHTRQAGKFRTRHRDYFLSLAEAAEDGIGGAEQGQWLEDLDAEHNNLRTALEWCFAETGGAEAGLRLLTALQGYWIIRGHLSEARELISTGLMRREGVPIGTQARALATAGTLAWVQSDLPGARALLEEGLTLLRQPEERRWRAFTLNTLGRVCHKLGDLSAASIYWTESHSIPRDVRDQLGIPAVLDGLATLARSEGDHTRARALYEESLVVARAAGDEESVAWALNNLGYLDGERGNEEGAVQLFQESLRSFGKLRHRLGIAHVLHGLGGIEATRGRPVRAARLFGAAEGIHTALGVQIDPMELKYRDYALAGVRTVLDEGALATDWAVGRAMTLEQVVAYALEELESCSNAA